jgi:hypothetical protein
VVGGPVCGRLVAEAEFAQRSFDKEYVFSFDDDMLEHKRAHNDHVQYIDLREFGSLHRLINDDVEDPSLRLLYWPPRELKRTPPVLPRRIFLVARRDVPVEAELTWDYGQLYHRHWEGEFGNEGRYDRLFEGDSDDDASSDVTGSEVEWTKENWACCDRCDKWRRLPPGVEYCDDALPEQWYCEMNPNSQRNSCEKPEERMARVEIWEE